ncbi:MAG: protoporphyrinogen oxidase [Thermoanaerobaculia bacterium]
MDASIVVVGGGLAGLAAAWRLRQAGARVRLFERSGRPGGVVGSRRVEGHLFEKGPATVPAAAPCLRRLIAAAGLGERLLAGEPTARRRYVWSHGALRLLPASPAALLGSDLLSWRAKLRLLAEPFIATRRDPGEETLAELLARRLGAETVRALADPFTAGVFAARPEELGADAFPRLKEWETEKGSLLRGLLDSRRQAQPGDGGAAARGLISFPDGLGELPEALGRALGKCLHLGSEVVALRPQAGGDGEWRVEARSTATGGGSRTCTAAAIVLAVTAPAAASLLRSFDDPAASILEQIPHTPVAVVGLGYRRDAVGHPLDGFGLLCASDSPLPIAGSVLGILFASSIFPGRAPQEGVTLTVIVGGTRDPEAVSLTDEALVERAQQACRALLDARGQARATAVERWHRAIPRYLPGHLRRIDSVQRRIGERALLLAGNYLRGVGLEATVRSGFEAAESLLTKPPVAG